MWARLLFDDQLLINSLNFVTKITVHILVLILFKFNLFDFKLCRRLKNWIHFEMTHFFIFCKLLKNIYVNEVSFCVEQFVL